MGKLLKRQLFCLLGVVFLSGCYSFTGVPSHGGGKRFYEEQRLVASAIQHSCKKLKLKSLKGQKTAVIVKSVETSGSGSVTHAGVRSGRLSYSLSDSLYDLLENSVGSSQYNRDIDRRSDNESQNVSSGIDLTLMPAYRSSGGRTEADLAYLNGVLEMKLAHEGIPLVPVKEAEYKLVLLIDSLGTKNSRLDHGLNVQESLEATCDIMYYASKMESGDLYLKSDRVSSLARYESNRVRFINKAEEKTMVKSGKSNLFPTQF